jgi:hypothetical protein
MIDACRNGHTDGRRPDGRCRGCLREQKRRNYARNPGPKIAAAMVKYYDDKPAQLQMKTALRQRRKDFIRGLKNAPCTDCGVQYHTDVMEFDHARGEKLFELSRAHKHSYERIKTEVAKCDLVCANCHRLRTVRRRQETEIQDLTS